MVVDGLVGHTALHTVSDTALTLTLTLTKSKLNASIRVKSVFCNCATLWSTIFYAFSGAHGEEGAALKYINKAKLRKQWDGKCAYYNFFTVYFPLIARYIDTTLSSCSIHDLLFELLSLLRAS